MIASGINDYGYAGAWCYYWKRNEDGSIEIENYFKDLIMKLYCDDLESGSTNNSILHTQGEYNDGHKLYTLYNSYHYGYDGFKDNGEWYYISAQYWNYVKENKYAKNKRFYIQSWLYSDYFYISEYTGNYWEYTFDANGNHPTVSGDGSVLTGGEESDYIKNHAKAAVINAGDGDDIIHNSGANTNIYGGAGDDYIYTDHENIIIDGDSGNDTIENDASWDNCKSSGVKINGGDGSDVIISLGTGTIRIKGMDFATVRGSYEKGSSRYNDMIIKIDNKIVKQYPFD